MTRIARLSLPALTALISATLALGCHAGPQTVAAPGISAATEEQIQRCLSEGDEAFQGMHLSAWRRAEKAYAQAFGLAPRKEIDSKLALTRLLRMTREIDEDIPCPTMADDIRFICQDAADPRGQALCDLARAYAAGPAAASKEMKRADPSVLPVDTSPLDAYIFALLSKAFVSDAKDDDLRKQLSEKYNDSPLFIYLNMGSGSTTLSQITQRSPDFAEVWELQAELSFQKTAIKQARAAFSTALALLPDYTRAINGLANIYFFTLEDYPAALKTYESALKRDPGNTAALFGKGAALHNMEEYQDSNAALDLMLASDLSRRGRVEANSVQYYRGEANYYKAYNYRLMKDAARARELIDIAKQDLPQAEEINYLSGLLYYDEGLLPEAKADFVRAVKTGKNCNAYHYLGLIEFKDGTPTAAAQFLTSSACFERSVRTYQEYIRSLSGLDVEADEKNALEIRMEMKLADYRDTSIQLVQRMIGMIRGSSINTTYRQAYMGFMSDLLTKLHAIGLPKRSEK